MPHHRPPIYPDSKKNRSILFAIRMTASRRSFCSHLASIDFESIEHWHVKYLPATYNGDNIFELPLDLEGILKPFRVGMDGISKHYDDHIWCKTMITNIKNKYILTYYKSTYTGHLECLKNSCDYIRKNNRKVKSTQWSGIVLLLFPVGGRPTEKLMLACKVC